MDSATASHSAVPYEHGEGDDDYLFQSDESFATNHRHLPELHRLSAFQQVTTKVLPAYDGRSSWFVSEDAIDDWSSKCRKLLAVHPVMDPTG